MGYMLRVRLPSFFAGAATASALGLYVLHRDYKVAHQSISQQVKDLYDSLDGRITALEKLKVEPSVQLEASE
ncbi:ABC transporter A family protein [Tasmannia lanceolata]|uniref:ABC transporter A family protein n=1 Tax=Tasmannia lanceolata TaxID=3420 RepID=UPI004064813C